MSDWTESVEKNRREAVEASRAAQPDYGSDPLGDGTFRMVPSGDIVDATERNKRLSKKRDVQNDCLGLSWDEIEKGQGGRLKRP